jgi:hypothetical protein
MCVALWCSGEVAGSGLRGIAWAVPSVFSSTLDCECENGVVGRIGARGPDKKRNRNAIKKSCAAECKMIFN